MVVEKRYVEVRCPKSFDCIKTKVLVIEMREEWLTRQEAARHLKISVRSLDRLGLPRANLGRRVLYDRQELDHYVLGLMVKPLTVSVEKSEGIRPVRLSSPYSRRNTLGGEWVKKCKTTTPA